MRRNLTAVVLVGALLWAVTGVSVLTLALHQHSHHSHAHSHHDALFTVLHGHAHESSPDHDHEVVAALSVSRTSGNAHLHIIECDRQDGFDRDPSQVRVASTNLVDAQDYGPPLFVKHGSFLI